MTRVALDIVAVLGLGLLGTGLYFLLPGPVLMVVAGIGLIAVALHRRRGAG